MKKNFVFLCAVLALTLASCGLPSETAETSDVTHPPEITVTVAESTEAPPETAEPVTTKETAEVTTEVKKPPVTAAPPVKDEPAEFDYKTSFLGDYIMLGKYLGIEVFVEPWDVLSEEQIDIELELYVEPLLENAAIYEGICKNGDRVNIDFIGTLDGNEFFGGDGEGYTLTLGKNEYILDVDSGIVGMAVGETRTVSATFPSDYGSQTYNGKTAVFDITLNYIYPTLTDEFVSANTEFESVGALRAHIKESARAEALQMLSDAVLTKAMANSYIIGLPDTEVERTLENIVGANRALADSLMMPYADFIMQTYGIGEDEAQSIFEDLAKNEVEQKLLIYAIARDMGLESLSDADYGTVRDSVIDELVKNANYVETLAN